MFLPGHRSRVAHAECAGTPRVMREAQMKTPNREQLGAEFWWWSLSLCRTFLNNACGLVRKRTESCGLITLRQHLMKPGAKTPLALLQ